MNMNMNPSAPDTSLNAWSVAWSLQPSELNVIVPLWSFTSVWLCVSFFLQKIESIIRERVTGTDEIESNTELFVASTNLTNFSAFENSSPLSACAAYSLWIIPSIPPSGSLTQIIHLIIKGFIYFISLVSFIFSLFLHFMLSCLQGAWEYLYLKLHLRPQSGNLQTTGHRWSYSV